MSSDFMEKIFYAFDNKKSQKEDKVLLSGMKRVYIIICLAKNRECVIVCYGD